MFAFRELRTITPIASLVGCHALSPVVFCRVYACGKIWESYIENTASLCGNKEEYERFHDLRKPNVFNFF